MRKLKNNKKAQAFTISDLGTIAISLVVAAIILGLGASILAKVQDGQTANTAAFNSSQFGLDGLATMASFIPTIALVAVAAVVIGVILVFFGRQR